MARDWKARTKLVHGGVRRSGYGEVSEAIFLTRALSTRAPSGRGKVRRLRAGRIYLCPLWQPHGGDV